MTSSPLASHFIQGKWISGEGPSFSSINPATGKMVWEGNAATQNEVNRAVSAAKQAANQWGNLTIQERISYFRRFETLLKENQNELSKIISEEMGKPRWESLSEVQSMIGKISLSIESQALFCSDSLKDQGQTRLVTRHKPHGTVAVFGPFNFPGHLPNGHIVPALLAGNTVVFKPSEKTPFTALMTVTLWQEAGLPDGVLNLVQGAKETGSYLAQHPDLNGIFFTGSWATGRWLLEHLADKPEKILALELGGNNPLVIGSISDIKAAAYQTIQSAFLTSGQRCTCARRLIIEEGKIGDLFLETLVHMASTIQIGAYTDFPEPFMGPLVSKEAANQLFSAYQNFVSNGAIELLPMNKSEAFISPSILDVTPVSSRADEEFFGPLLQVIRVPSFSEAINEANNTVYGLAAGLFSDDPEQYQQFRKKIRAGLVNWNVPLTGASSAAPFGGIGHSGNHRPSAWYAAYYCSYPVASVESDRLQMPSKIVAGIKGTS